MKLHISLSNGRPFTSFTFTIQPIHRCHSLRVFVHCAGDFEGCITLSGRFRWRSEGSGCDLFSLMPSPAPPTVHQHDDSRVTLTTLPAARVVSRGVQRVGKGDVLVASANRARVPGAPSNGVVATFCATSRRVLESDDDGGARPHSRNLRRCHARNELI